MEYSDHEKMSTRSYELLGEFRKQEREYNERAVEVGVKPVYDHPLKAASLGIALLGNAVNGASSREIAKTMLEQLTREHRYLQNALIFALLEMLQQYGELDEKRFVDDRNRHAHSRCASIEVYK